jgi:FkbM family methyltransferase
VKLSVPIGVGGTIEFECADTLISRWVSRAILEGDTYPQLPFLDDVRVVFDVGANCGAASVWFAHHYPQAQVHAFEPASEPRAYLERNAAARSNIHVHAVGLHAIDQKVPLYCGDGDSGYGSVFRRWVNLPDSEQVILRNGGAWAAERGIDRIDILKVDVEGCEVEVVSGLAELLPRCRRSTSSTTAVGPAAISTGWSRTRMTCS